MSLKNEGKYFTLLINVVSFGNIFQCDFSVFFIMKFKSSNSVHLKFLIVALLYPVSNGNCSPAVSCF